MKTKRQNHHRGWKQALSVLLVFALAAGLVLSVPALSGIAYAAPTLWGEGDGETPVAPDPEDASDPGLLAPSTVTVKFSKTMTGEEVTDLDKDKTVADLYLIAHAVRLSGYNVYAYCVDSSMPYYAWVKDYVVNTDGWRAQEYDAAPEDYPGQKEDGSWLVFRYAPGDAEHASVDAQEGLAQLMAQVCFAPELLPELKDEDVPIPTALALEDPSVRTKIGTQVEGVPAGLYLNVVHHVLENWKDYVVLVHQKDAPESDPGKVNTIAYSDTKVYTFKPQLISLPGLGVDADGNPRTDTTQNANWVYDMTVTAKGEAADRYADLVIKKQLDRVVEGVSAVFVFRVDAYKPGNTDNMPDYTETITLRADNLESKVITGKIPVGSTVVISEVYSGAGYQFSNAAVTPEWNVEEGKDKNDPLPAISTTPGENGTVRAPEGNGITIYNIPAGRIYLTATSGEENILMDGTTETAVITNTHDNNNSGGAVVNSFAPGAAGGWTWTKRTMNEQGEWVNDPAGPATQN